MGIPYLRNLPWSHWTRDERFFCSILYSHASADPTDFAEWLIESTKLSADKGGKWDLGFEVCFYRDYLWQLGESARSMGFPQKRTFDLCLFGKRSLIVIEAKVFERFESSQSEYFKKDKRTIPCLPGLNQVKAYVIALASSTYYENAKTHGRSGSMDVFDGCVSWDQLAKKYSCPLMDRADQLYKRKRGDILDRGSASGSSRA